MPAYPKDYLKNYPTQSCPECGGSGEDAQGGQCPDCRGSRYNGARNYGKGLVISLRSPEVTH